MKGSAKANVQIALWRAKIVEATAGDAKSCLIRTASRDEAEEAKECIGARPNLALIEPTTGHVITRHVPREEARSGQHSSLVTTASSCRPTRRRSRYSRIPRATTASAHACMGPG
ncbi:hypothetical protein MRX96_001877 [Rhipicephalus microplus]